MIRRPLAPHVQAAISAAAQPRVGAVPAAKPAPAPHVQAAVARTIQPKAAAPEVRRPAPHVQAALSPAAQPRTAPLQTRPVAPHVQAAVVQPRPVVSSPPSRQPAAHVQASVAAIQPKSQNGVIQQVKFWAFFNGKYQTINSKDIVKDSSQYTSSRTIPKILHTISIGEDFPISRSYIKAPTDNEKEEAAEALKVLGKDQDVQKSLRKKLKREAEALRLQQVGKEIESLAGKITDDEYKKGSALSIFGEKSLTWSIEKFKTTDTFKENVKKIEKQTDTTLILENQTPFQQVESLLESKPQTNVLNLGGSNLWVVETTDQGRVIPTRLQVNMGGGSSYHEMSKKTVVPDDLRHQQLYVLERLRDPKSMLSESIKEDLYRKGKITSKERFDDSLKTTYQELKKETRESYPKEVKRVQISSSFFNLERSVEEMKDTPFGTPVIDRKRTKIKKKNVHRPTATPSSLKRKFDDYFGAGKGDKRNKKKRKLQKVELRKEVTRLNRSMIREDYSSEEDSDVSDTEMVK